MAVVGISFGSATGGTGFDVAATVSSIMANMRMPETNWANQTTALQAQDAALSSLGTNLSALSSSLAALTSFDGAFAQKEGAVSDNSVVALTNATTDAAAGTHTLSIQRLATTSAQHSSAIPAGATLSGSFSLRVGSGTNHTITLDSSNNTVAGLAAAINSLAAGAHATVVSDSSGSRISLVSVQSGAASDITSDSSGLTDANGTGVTFTGTQPGQDAAYTLDGIALTSASNTVSSALAGITFQLLGTASSDVTLQIANNTTAIATALTNFTAAYNTLSGALTAQESKDTTGKAQPLFGDQTLSLMQAQLATALAFVTTNTGARSNLAQLGISFSATGQLQLDSNALSQALSSNFSGAANFFQNSGDFGQNLTRALNQLGTDGNGALALRLNQNTVQEQTLADNKTNLELRLSAYETSLTSKLTLANEILQSIPQQLEETRQIYAAITGYNSSR